MVSKRYDSIAHRYNGDNYWKEHDNIIVTVEERRTIKDTLTKGTDRMARNQLLKNSRQDESPIYY